MRLFIFGYGFSARPVAAQAQAMGFSVAATSRDPDKRAAMTRAGIEAFDFSALTPLPPGALDSTTHILSSIGPDDDGDPVLRLHGKDILRLPDLAWIGYLSSTGVYGDKGGDWVDEDSPCAPSGPRSRRRLAAEGRWRDLFILNQRPVHVFRLAGIYGPERSYLEQILTGGLTRIMKPGHVFSRIHVDDIARAVMASVDRPAPGTVYNVCDDLPAPQSDVVAYAYRMLGRTPPPPVDFAKAAAEMSPMALSFWRDNKRVHNDRIKALGLSWRYPTYKEGLQSVRDYLRQRA